MLENPISMGEFKMSHKKKEHSKHKHHGHEEHSGHRKLGMVEPMAHGKGAEHLKPMKDHKGMGRGK